MNLNVLTFPAPRAINTLTYLFRRSSLAVHLPIMAIQWFENVERISDGLIHLNFNPNEEKEAIRLREYTSNSLKIIILNAKWNVLWSKYILTIIQNKLFPIMKYSFNNVVRFNHNFLKDLGEESPSIDTQPVELSGIMGFDLITGDLVGNSYVDSVWAELVDNLSAFTLFRSNYIEATANPSYFDSNTAIIAKSIALAEIAWSNSFFPFRDVSDMIMFETIWKARFSTGMMNNFIKAANLAGADLPTLSSKEIIRRIAENPDKPIEEVIL